MTRTESAVSTPVRTWKRSYAVRLFFTDALSIVVAVAFSQLVWLKDGQSLAISRSLGSNFTPTYTLVSILIALLWLFFLDFFGAREHKNIGAGTIEYRRVADATLRLFGLLAIVAFLLGVELGRGYFLTALPLGLFLLLVSRWLWRQWLRNQQREGNYLSRALLIGQRLKSEHVARTVSERRESGIIAIGALTKLGHTEDDIMPGVPVLGTYKELLPVIDRLCVDMVMITGADDLGPKHMRQLGWDLEARNVELIVAPALTDVAGPRIHARPVAGLPLIHVEFPQFEGRKQWTKRLFDIVGSSILLLLTSPLLLGVAIAVRASSPGPIFYTQERVGLRGRRFGMLKFRSMVQGADDQLASLLDAQGTSDTPLFKVINDPRITPVGRFIRKYSLDEFPQLLNVLLGQMSLVGPRPQREAEVALYDDAAHRRLFMKPGMSGLWQVSGRSKLSWEDAIRLDLYYVENWSITGDMIILWRTISAVAAADGAH
ncbi:sugar transferase [Microterricola viridarii]|uniref:Undecaprenyl-phosphate galactose phosphotransferase, WbaP/exopolysaccharide biosynthesis polyprenyl glycosylphosphotransferase n=1 Tax=Microterricola viridarii TaxID=412690 RepID=A0A1H1ZK27_9MICO|nr:sugar transferase [Microterricola viridarii]SDT34020.1 Undecaprenyl-phosphate galactose phosphotransferase, WbaP/exopolysaccharide biosynthesis polyprenyl glycosylphosphotransferase [Microterricola viridarii]